MIVRGRVLDMGQVKGKYKNWKRQKYERAESKMCEMKLERGNVIREEEGGVNKKSQRN